MRLRIGLLAAALLAVLSAPAFAAGMFSQYPAATSGNITATGCIPMDVYGPNAANSQGVNPATVCVSPDEIMNYGLTVKNKYSVVPVGSVAYGSFGTSTTPVAGTQYWANLDIPVSKTLTGIGCLNGATAATDLLIYGLWNSSGVLIANTALAGVVAASADTFQQIAFTATKAVTPGRYFIGWQTNGTTTRFRTIAASTFIDVVTASDTGSFATLETLTVPTTFTADKGPICYVY